VQDGMVGASAAPKTKPFLQLGIPADVQMFHRGEGRCTANQSCISCLKVRRFHQRLAPRLWIISPPCELQLRTLAPQRRPNLLCVGIRPAHQSKGRWLYPRSYAASASQSILRLHSSNTVGHAHRCEPDRCAAPRNKSV
jgi:hypothetical protein